MKAEILNNKIVLSGRILNKILFHIKMIPGHKYNSIFGYWEVPVTNKNINSLVCNNCCCGQTNISKANNGDSLKLKVHF